MTRVAKPDARWFALVVLCAGMLMILLDQTIVNVALPDIRADLGFTQAGLAWVVNAYLIAFGGLLLLAGRLGDLIGRRRIFLLGIAVFTVASLVCGLSGWAPLLIVARFVQGAGGAMATAVTLGMIVTMFPKPAEQARAIGVFSFVAAAGASVGLLLGGVLTQTLNWHWIFFVNLPIGVVTAYFAVRLVPADRGLGLARGADALGAVLITVALMLAVYTIVEVEHFGWVSAHTLGLGAVAVALGAAFFTRQARTANPLLPLRIFRSRAVSGANAVVALTVAGMFGMLFLGSLYLQQVLHYDELRIGLAFLPVGVAIGALSIGATARLCGRFGERPVLITGLALVGLGLVLFATAPTHADYWADLLPSMAAMGIGAGLVFPAMTTLAMSGATGADAGLASGLMNTTTQVGAAIGLAVLATLSTAHTAHRLAAGIVADEALTDGFQLAFLVGAGLVGAAVVVAAVVIRQAPAPAGPAAERVAA